MSGKSDLSIGFIAHRTHFAQAREWSVVFAKSDLQMLPFTHEVVYHIFHRNLDANLIAHRSKTGKHGL